MSASASSAARPLREILNGGSFFETVAHSGSPVNGLAAT
jgi:hypothetical protein